MEGQKQHKKGIGSKMSRRETYESRTEELLLPIADGFGVEIYDVEYVNNLRFSYIYEEEQI